MRHHARVLAVLLSVSLLPAAAAASPASAEATGHITSVTADPGPIRVDGLTGYADATISVVATDDRGAIGDCAARDFYGWNLVRVNLRRTIRPHDTVSAYLNRTSVDTAGEHWSGTWRIGSTRTGVWTITSISWCQGHVMFAVDPRDLGLPAHIAVVGTHIPTVTYAYVPAVVPYLGRQWLVATYRDGYGKPLARYPIVYGQDDQYEPPGKSVMLTDSTGRLTVRVVHRGIQGLYFANPGTLSRPSTLLAFYRLAGPMYFKSVTASVTPTVVRLGRAVTVTGTVAPNSRAPVALQRLVGRTWRDVSLGVQRPSGHVTFTYVSTTLGPVYLRIIARQPPATIEFLVPTPSHTMVITVVRR
jgi:hypothetical protein